MRRPRDEESFKEFNYVSKIFKDEKLISQIPGNLPKVALIFPNDYEVASSSLAWSWIEQLLANRGIGVERFFYEPWFKRFYSVEEQRPIDEFSTWLFTFQFENDLRNIADLLIKRGIPLNASDRENYHPLIIIGGPVNLFNVEILSDIADLLFVGDLECAIDQVSQALMNDNKFESIKEMLKIPQVYSKVHGKENFKNCQGTLDIVPFSHFTTPHSVFKNKLLVEIGRGCIRRCAFCVTGYTKKPVKFANAESVIEIFRKYKTEEFGLISATITDYPYLNTLLDHMERENIKFSVSSMRVDDVNERLLKMLKMTDHKSFTVAPEGISQRIREIMLKDITQEGIFNGLTLGRNVGFEHVKLYYIIGFSEETSEDYREFFWFIDEVNKMGYRKITLSINPLVPKPKTPFEYRKMIDRKDYEERIKYIKKNLQDKAKIYAESYKESFMQYQISRLKGIETIEFIKENFMKK